MRLVRFLRAEIDGRLIAVARVDDGGAAYRLGRNYRSWMRVPDLDRLAKFLPVDQLFWVEVDVETSRSSVAELGGTWGMTPDAVRA